MAITEVFGGMYICNNCIAACVYCMHICSTTDVRSTEFRTGKTQLSHTLCGTASVHNHQTHACSHPRLSKSVLSIQSLLSCQERTDTLEEKLYSSTQK